MIKIIFVAIVLVTFAGKIEFFVWKKNRNNYLLEGIFGLILLELENRIEMIKYSNFFNIWSHCVYS